ncbi:MAG: hypothetical protein V3U25_01225, partial [Nitrososphaerales archaeon]
GTKKVNRRGFLKWGIAAAVGAAAVAGGAGYFLKGQAPTPTPSAPTPTPTPGQPTDSSPTPRPTRGGGRWGNIGDPIKLTVGYQPYCTCNWDASANRQAGLWKKHLPAGSEVNWFEALSGPLLNNNLVAGKNAFIYACDTPASRTFETAPATTISYQCYEYAHPDYLVDILGRKPTPGPRGKRTTPDGSREVPKTFQSPLLGRKDLVKSGEIKGPEDFDGRKIGVPMGSYSHRQGEAIRDQYGVNPVYLDQSIELHVAQLRAKHIDGVLTWGPYPRWIELQGLADILISAPEMQCTCTTGSHFHHAGVIVGLEEIVEQRPYIISGWLQAEEDARALYAGDQANGTRQIADLVFSDTPEVPRDAIDVTVDEFAPDGYMYYPKNLKHYEQISTHWRKVGVLKGKKSEDLNYYTNNYAFGPRVKEIYDQVLEERRAQGLHAGGDGEIVDKYW